MANQSDLIKQLRAMTQAGFMDCKKALDQSGNDLDAAVKWLRENGIAKAAKKIDSVASEGVVALKRGDAKAVMLEINSQTDFVSKNELFQSFASDLAEAAFASSATDADAIRQLKLKTGKTVAETEVELTATIGEKISVRRAASVSAQPGETLSVYLHANKRIGVIAATAGDCPEEFLKHIAMHIAANNPKFVSKQEVDQAWLESERQLIASQVKLDEAVQQKLQKVPESSQANLLNTIVEGRVNKLLTESCLESQQYLIDGSKKVGDVLKEKGAAVKRFVRFEVGEGIEKKADNFADEVKAQMKK